MRSLLVLLVLLTSFTAYAETKIAVLDVERAVGESNDGKAAMAKLKGEMDKLQKDLDAKKTELKKADEDLAKQQAILKPDALEKKRQELGQKVQALQEYAMRAQKDLSDKERKATTPILEKVNKAVAAVAARDKVNLVLHKNAVVWPNQSELDITNEVIRKVNETK